MIELNLDSIASHLEGLEETIIHKLIDRAQWRANDVVYIAGQSGFTDEQARSLFEVRLYYQEKMDAAFGRFRVPEERPFNGDLPIPQRIFSATQFGLHIDDFDKVNLTKDILNSYRLLLPLICPTGDDGQYGSSVEHDVYAVQAIARRIHYGALYVAECKFRSDANGYGKLIHEKNCEALMEKLTRKDVENKIIARVKSKVKNIQAKINKSVRNLISPEPIIVYYKEFLIPETKKGEVLYLLNRETGAND